MNKLRAIIVDDEFRARENLKLKLLSCKLEIEILAEADSVDSGIQIIKKHKPDVVFLDIAMPVKSGFDLIKEIDIIDFEIIFVTAFDKYAIEAFEHNAIGYILKPISDEKLINTVATVSRRLVETNKYEHLQKLLKHLDNSSKKITIKSIDSIEIRDVEEIVRLESDGNYTLIYISDGNKIVSSSTLGSFEETLVPNGFYRTHRSHLINHMYFRTYNKSGFVTLKDGTEVPIAKRQKQSFINFLNSFN